MSAGQSWHQHIRKVCHLERWAFRGFHAAWTPVRLRPFGEIETIITVVEAEAKVGEPKEKGLTDCEKGSNEDESAIE